MARSSALELVVRRRCRRAAAVERSISVGEDFIGTQSGLMIEDRRGDHQFVDGNIRHKGVQTPSHGLAAAHERVGQHMRGAYSFCRGPVAVDIVYWRAKLATAAAQKVGEALLGRREQPSA